MSERATTQVLSAVPEEKAAKKVRDTVLGVALMVFGALSAFVSFALMLRVVWTGGSLDMWSAIFTGAPMVVGVFLGVLGGLVASGELVRAGLKDITALLKFWKRNGNGGATS